MTFQTPLQASDYTKLRGTGTQGNNSWWAKQFITLCKNTVVFAARVNGAISSSSFAQITFDTVTVGAFGDVEIGETFFLSHTSDIRAAYYRGRVRAAATSTLLKVNETSVNITDNDYIFVVYDFDGWDKLSRMVGSTQYQDWDVAYHSLAPVVVGLRTAYVNWDPADGVYRIAFDVSASYAADEYSSNVLTYQFTFVAGTYTVISGALNTAIVTVDFNANTEQWGKLVITDSQGTVRTRRFYIRAHGSTDTPSMDFSGVQITGSLDGGWNATVNAWNGVSSVLNQTFCVVWCQEYYNGTLGPVSIANNIDMVGRFHREDNHGRGDALYSYVADVKFDIEGICTQMQRLQEQDLTTINKSVAAVWDEISFNTPQRSIVYYLAEHSTFLSLCDLTFPDGFDLTYLFQYFPNQGGNVLDAVKGIATQINANVEFAPDGRIQVVRDTRFLTDKSGVVVVGDFDNRDFTTTDLPVDPVNKTGRLDAYGAANVGGSITADRSRAPGNAQGYAAGQSTLDAQVLAAQNNAALAQAELNFRAGQQMAIDNLTYSQDWQSVHGGYHFLIPSRGQRVTHTYTTATNLRGLSFGLEDHWQIVSVTINHDNASGARTVSTHEELEPPTGDSGDTVPQIAGGTQTNPILLQPLDPFPSLPDDPANYLPDDPTPNPYPPLIPPKNGNTVIVTDGEIDDTSRSVIAQASPTWTGATPIDLGSFIIQDICFDLTTIKPPVGAALVASDSIDSAIWYTPDAFAKPAVWTKGATTPGLYSKIASFETPGAFEIYSPTDLATSITLSYTIGTGPATANVGDVLTMNSAAGGGGGAGDVSIDFTASLTCKMTILTAPGYVLGSGVGSGPSFPFLIWYTPSGVAVGQLNKPTSTTVLNMPPKTVADRLNMDTGGTAVGGGAPFSITVRIDEIIGGTTCNVVATGDYGATLGSVRSPGASPGAYGGYDVTRLGATPTRYAAASGQVMLSTGAAFSNAPGGTLSSGQPVNIVVPYRRWPHGAVQYSDADPDYLLGASAVISGSCLWKVNGSSGALTAINPAASAVCIRPNLATVWQSSSICKIAIVVNVSGSLNLYTSLDAGITWSLSRACSNPIYLRCRRNDPNGTQLYLIDGSTLYISRNWGVSWLARTMPSTNVGVAMDIYA